MPRWFRLNLSRRSTRCYITHTKKDISCHVVIICVCTTHHFFMNMTPELVKLVVANTTLFLLLLFLSDLNLSDLIFPRLIIKRCSSLSEHLSYCTAMTWQPPKH